MRLTVTLVLLLAVALAGCATKPAGEVTLTTAAAPAWSLNISPGQMVISVNPAKNTLRIAGSTGAIVGAGISAVANDKHRQAVEAALGAYNPNDALVEALAQALDNAVPGEIAQVGPLGSTAGFDTRRDAQDARYESLAKQGYDLLLNLKATYGLFGPGADLALELDGDLISLPDGRKQWADGLTITPVPILATDKLADPANRLGTDFGGNLFTSEEGAVGRWTENGGEPLRQGLQTLFEGGAAALITAMGQAQNAVGAYHLGKDALYEKDLERASQWFKQALAWDPTLTDARNGLSVALAHNGQVKDAVALAEEILAANPAYEPARYNLAYWYAVSLKDPDRARPYYEKSRAAGAPSSAEIEKALQP
ncbi:MAG: tetratricopeptide repeat protein [Candidatus Hydrogenedentes bacterium]|nr:tetratricopeptide repeat protein [Candidatus Hydrogenedentota bacterium]